MQIDINRPDLTVGVIGTGAMGRGIAQVAAAGGVNVLVNDARPGAAKEARDFIEKMGDHPAHDQSDRLSVHRPRDRWPMDFPLPDQCPGRTLQPQQRQA